MTQFLGNGRPQRQVDEVPGGILVVEEVPEETEGSRVKTKFIEVSRPP